jgi:hypothetical protein
MQRANMQRANMQRANMQYTCKMARISETFAISESIDCALALARSSCSLSARSAMISSRYLQRNTPPRVAARRPPLQHAGLCCTLAMLPVSAGGE